MREASICCFPHFLFMSVMREKGTRDSRAPTWRGRLWRYGPVVGVGVLCALRFVVELLGVEHLAHHTTVARLALPGHLRGRARAGSLPRPQGGALRGVRAAALCLRRAPSARLRVPRSRDTGGSPRSRSSRRSRSFDEYHQSLVPTRTGTIYDSLLDMAGGASALACASLWLAARRRKAVGAAPPG